MAQLFVQTAEEKCQQLSGQRQARREWEAKAEEGEGECVVGNALI